MSDAPVPMPPVLAELMPRLHNMARRYAVKSGTICDVDDYAQEARIAAWLSLAKPADSQLHARNRALKAGWGAILDLARRSDWMHRSDRRLLTRAQLLRQQQPGVSTGHIASQLGTTSARIHAIVWADRLADFLGNESATPADQTEADVQRAQLTQRLPSDLAALAPHLRHVVCRLLTGHSLTAIAADCRLTTAGVSVRLKTAVRLLHARVDGPPHVQAVPQPHEQPSPSPPPPAPAPEPAPVRSHRPAFVATDYRGLIRGPMPTLTVS